MIKTTNPRIDAQRSSLGVWQGLVDGHVVVTKANSLKEAIVLARAVSETMAHIALVEQQKRAGLRKA